MSDQEGGYTVALRAAAGLVPYARNARTHSAQQVSQIEASMVEFGFTVPILADGKGIVAGHGRKQAAMNLFDKGVEIRLPNGTPLPHGMVPVIDCTGWTEAQRQAYILADNQLPLNAGWDNDLLKIEIGELKGLNFDVSLLGFEDDFLAKLLADPNEGKGDADEAPPAPALPVSELGDVWTLGKHRLICGDSTDADTVATVLNGVWPELGVTDPPYGVKYDPGKRAKGLNDGATRATGKVKNDHRADWQEAWALVPCTVLYVWHAGMTRFEVEKSLRDAGFTIRAEIIWKKEKPTLSPGNIAKHSMGYNWQHEACLYAVKDGGKVKWCGDKSQSTVWDIAHPKSETGHGTQKPVEAMLRPIQNNSSPGQGVYDPFVGSGTTIIACEMSGRVCYAVELDPAYVDVCILRWQTFTGETAVHADGRTFTEVLAERRPETPLQQVKK